MILEKHLTAQKNKLNELFIIYNQHSQDVESNKGEYSPGFERICLMDIYTGSSLYSELAKIQLELDRIKVDFLDQTQREKLEEIIETEQQRQESIKENIAQRAEEAFRASH